MYRKRVVRLKEKWKEATRLWRAWTESSSVGSFLSTGLTSSKLSFSKTELEVAIRRNGSRTSRCRDHVGGNSLRGHECGRRTDRAKARVNFHVKVAGVGNQLAMTGKGKGVTGVFLYWIRNSPRHWTTSEDNSLFRLLVQYWELISKYIVKRERNLFCII